MRRLLATSALALLAAASHAQTAAPPEPRRPNVGERALIVVGALGGGFVTAYVLGPVAPLGAVAGTYGTGRLLGFETSLGSVAVGAAAGTAVAVGVGSAAYYVTTEVQGYDADLSAAIGSAALGLAAGAVATALLYDGRRVEVAPAVLAVLGGDRAPGLALRVRL